MANENNKWHPDQKKLEEAMAEIQEVKIKLFLKNYVLASQLQSALDKIKSVIFNY